MRHLRLVFFTLASNAFAADSITASDIIVRVSHEGGKHVLADLWEHQPEFDVVLSGIESANRQWLQVAVLLRPFSDAGTSEEIDMAVARALPKNPERILSLIGHNGFDLDFVCTSPFIEPAPGVAEDYERRTLAALSRIKNPDLKPVASECAKHVKAPPAAGQLRHPEELFEHAPHMDDIDQTVLNWSRDDFESPATIVENVSNDMQRKVTEIEVFNAYRRLVASGLVTAYRFDASARAYRAHVSSELSQGDDLWFLAVRGP